MSDGLVAVGCAGAGTLGGGAIMRRLAERGHRVLVWNRSADKLASLSAAGATAVATPAAPRLLQDYLPKMAASDLAVEGRLDIMLEDLAMVGDLARASGAVMPVTALVEQLYRQQVAHGLGDRDNAEFVRLYRDATPA